MRLGPLSADRHRLFSRLLDEVEAEPGMSRISPSGADRSRLALSAAQRRIWFFAQLRPRSPLYNVVGTARLRGTVHRDVLSRCLDEIVRRHETLRTTFHQDDDEPWCRVRPPQPLELPVHDSSALPAGERDDAVAQQVVEEARRPFDLTRDPMLRTVLLKTGPDDHTLIVCLHHIAADGWSLGLLVRELGILYERFRAGLTSPLPEPALQYADFTEWERVQPVEEGLGYWETRLAGLAPVDLPTDRPRQSVASFAGESVPVGLSADLVDRLNAVGSGERATSHMVLLAGFALLLSRWSGRPDVVVAASAANRTRVETEEVFGCFVNTLPLRVDLAGRPGFRELVRRVRDGFLADYAHQDAPFDRVVEGLRPERDRTGFTPLLRHTLVLADPSPRVRLPDLDIEVEPVRTGTAKFELRLELAPGPDGGLAGVLEYSSELYDDASVRRLAAGFSALLTAAAADPDRPVDRLDLVEPAELDRLVHDLSGAGTPAAADSCLHELFERRAEQAPDSVAVVDGDSRLTYRQLDERANRFAHFLRERSIGIEHSGTEQRVGVCLPRSAELLAVLLGVLKAGAAFVPLDPGLPAARIAFLIRDSGASMVLTGSGLLPPEIDAPTVLLDESTDLVDGQSADRVAPVARPANCAYVIYTSGSTGQPKGVCVEHRAVANLLTWLQTSYRMAAHEAAVFKGSIAFDVTVGEWAWPLTSGARVVVAPGDAARDPAGLAALIRDERVTTVNFVPSLLRAFLADPAAAQCRDTLRRVMCGGEGLPRDLAEQCRATLPDTELTNLYGPTEATIDVTSLPADPAAVPDRFSILPIGRPMTGSRLYVLDDRMAPVPVGVAAELYIGGAVLARGYQGRPTITAERFVPDPFSAGGRLYRTGDKARWLDDGNLEFLGRLDDQVKIRGQRIEPTEIEAVLARHPAVDRAVVTVVADADGAAALAAYLSPADGSSDSDPDETASELAGAVREYARGHLPDSMVPAHFTVLTHWPTGPTGKLDRAALPPPAYGRSADRVPTAPRTPTERQVMEIWAAVLNTDLAGVEDDFFDVGGHSLLAAKLVARIRAAFGVALSLERLFGDPTIAGVAAQLDAARAGQSAASPIARAQRRPLAAAPKEI
jgi:amino acid adenylation domain-containing protein